jgi:N-acetylneuraminic acid mutarotase
MVRGCVLAVGLTLLLGSTGEAWAQGRWESAAPLEGARAGLGVEVLDGRLYAVGGAGLAEPRNDLEMYAPVLGAWRAESPLPNGLERFGLATLNDRLFVAGGYAAGQGVRPVDEVWSYSAFSGVWSSEPDMPGAKADFVLVAAGGKLYALGGTGDAAIHVFDPGERSADAEPDAPSLSILEAPAGEEEEAVGAEWTSLEAPVETARRGAAGVALDGEIYLIGGEIDGAATARVDVFNIESGEWRRAPDLPEPRSAVAAVVVDGRIHVLGGRNAALDATLDAHSAWRPGEEGWTAMPALPEPRTEADAAVLDGRIFLVGGGAGGGYLAPFTALDATDVFIGDPS